VNIAGFYQGIETMQIFVRSLSGRTISIEADDLSCAVGCFKIMIQNKEGIPPVQQRLVFAGKELEDNMTLIECNIQRESTISLSLRLLGGKGGFGAMLRAQAKKKTHKTTDFSMCRDLSGRRLRHVNDEIILAKWREAKDKGEEFDINEVRDFSFYLNLKNANRQHLGDKNGSSTMVFGCTGVFRLGKIQA